MPDRSSVATVVVQRLAPHLGPHVANMAMKTFSQKALGIQPDAARSSDLPKLLDALRPMLTVMLGREHAEVVIGEIRGDFGSA
jgi:hypothetical protein